MTWGPLTTSRAIVQGPGLALPVSAAHFPKAARHSATCPSNGIIYLVLLENLERANGFEPSTLTLARLCSTPELRPRSKLGGVIAQASGGFNRLFQGDNLHGRLLVPAGPCRISGCEDFQAATM